MIRSKTLFLALLAALCTLTAGAQLQKGDFVAIAGDSITEQKQYSVFRIDACRAKHC